MKEKEQFKIHVNYAMTTIQLLNRLKNYVKYLSFSPHVAYLFTPDMIKSIFTCVCKENIVEFLYMPYPQ